MKKQIFYLTFLSLAFLIAGVSKSFGQTEALDGPLLANGQPDPYVKYLDLGEDGAVTCLKPTALTCLAEVDALHPQAGISYVYSIDIFPEGENHTIHWFVTDEQNIITALNNLEQLGVVDASDGTGKYILEAGEEYNDVNNLNNSIRISWKSFTDDPTAPVLLVTYVLDSEGCTDNIEVYRIQPVFNFILEIAGLDNEGNPTTTPSDCVSPIETAEYDVDLNQLVVDYGENWLFFIVSAANFATSWMPKFQVTYTGNTASDIEVYWAYPDDAISETGTWYQVLYDEDDDYYSGSTPVSVQAEGQNAVAEDGECIIVRVRIDHGANENPDNQDQTVTLAVDGNMFDPALENHSNDDLADLSNPETGDDCIQVPFDDVQAYTLTSRPRLDSTTPDVKIELPDEGTEDFEPKNQ